MKGISELVSAAILVAIGITMVSLYSGWATHFAEDTAGNVANSSNRDLKCSNSEITINDAEYDRSSDEAEFDLENVGTINFPSGIYVATFNDSILTGRREVTNLEVGEERKITLETGEIPDEILVTLKECPETKATEDKINVHP